MPGQLNLDFTGKSLRPTDKTQDKRIGTACDEDLLACLDIFATRLSTDRSNLIYRYVVEGLQRDMAHFLPLPHMNRTLKQILMEKK